MTLFSSFIQPFIKSLTPETCITRTYTFFHFIKLFQFFMRYDSHYSGFNTKVQNKSVIQIFRRIIALRLTE